MEKYSPVKNLGTGASGKTDLVKLVSDESKKFARKEIEMRARSESESAERRLTAEDEVSVLRDMSHSNITQLVDSFFDDEKFYIVMEVAEGGDLSTAIEDRRLKHQYWTEPEVLLLFVQMCFGLAHMHKKHVLHRDIKPQNIFLTEKGVVKVGDLGAHTYLHDLQVSREFAGTYAYSSPEKFRCRSEGYSFPSDVWSLGVVLYEMLALDLPFPGDDIIPWFNNITKTEPNYALIEERYSKDLVDLVKSMLRKNPSERPTMPQILESEVLRRQKRRLLSFTYMPKRTSILPRKTLTMCEWLFGWWSRMRQAKLAYTTLKIDESQRAAIEKEAAAHPTSNAAWMDVYRAFHECNREVIFATIGLARGLSVIGVPESELPEDPVSIATTHALLLKTEQDLVDIKDALVVLEQRFRLRKWSVELRSTA